MAEINHAERAHATLSASGAHRWMACTPSAMLEKDLPDTTSEFAKEGTTAHELSEIYLSHEIGEINKSTRTRRINRFKKENAYYSQEMIDYVEKYVDIVVEKINEAKARSDDAVILLEQRLDFSEWVPRGYGTGDVVIISDGHLEVVDLKYGKGVEVSAVENEQLRLYGLGAFNQFDMLYDIETVSMTIVQPRLDNLSTETLEAETLVEWAKTEVKPKADLAWSGEGEFVAGDHCRFCKLKATCRARAEENLKMAQYEFDKPAELSLDEIGQILFKAGELQKWAKDIEKYAFDQAEKHGKKVPGWKLVEGRSNRKYADEAKVLSTLKVDYELDSIAPRKILGITAMEKAIGKKVFAEKLSDLVIKPAGKPTLVPEGDKRPELNSTASAQADFK
ncbi:DUF2800 domain-containing protein [Amphibacillus sp. MSJ-3]|uniref:DUF2800 domain-containing protein n=1 Tax=Amphibacillus sp. MSJ-3 TaxID=2841505 RepID=UPI001C0EEAE6|nr:DUF2800 domain-containing protein [Amphibacillus sp. MSJ-3]MBU5594891.1 DUF2800 domain-containing protein [Amphibacillus sp. MSJ-3]